MEKLIHIASIALIAGVGGTGLGGVIGSFFRKGSNKVISLLLSLTSGVMIAIVCLDLMPESIQAARDEFGVAGVFVGMLSILIGMLLVMLLNRIIDKSTEKQVPHTASNDHPSVHDDIDELTHVNHYNEHSRQGANTRELWSAGIVIACAIALHNVPEGMSIGASYAIENDGAREAIMLASLIGLHNIPEGMAVTVPLVAGGMGRLKAVLLTALSGVPMAIGACLGLWIGDIGSLGLSCSLGFASGAMLYVVFGEIMPQAILMYRSRVPAILVVVGLLLGMCLIYL